MATLFREELTFPEAAYVAGVSERVINQEIEAHVLKPRVGRHKRCLGSEDVIYLAMFRDMRPDMTPKLRKRFRSAIAEAIRDEGNQAQVDFIVLHFGKTVKELSIRLVQLKTSRDRFIETRSGVLGGDPILKGTRISPHFVADLLKGGTSAEEISEELDLSLEQIDAAELFAKVSPRRGRPSVRRQNITEHVSADR
jgi:uncharacterized protein (DUF433 family)